MDWLPRAGTSVIGRNYFFSLKKKQKPGSLSELGIIVVAIKMIIINVDILIAITADTQIRLVSTH